MIAGRIVCERTGEKFSGTPAEALALGWRNDWVGWHSPALGWQREPRRPWDAPDSIDYSAIRGAGFSHIPIGRAYVA